MNVQFVRRVCVVCSCLAGLLVAEDDLRISPSFHITGVVGTSSSDEPGEFAPGGHDPSRKDDLILQSLEPSLSLWYGDHFRAFVTGLAFTDENDDVEWEWEEYFGAFYDLPGGLEVRGGRMLNRVGFHNSTHLHSWTTVDAPLPHALFLGEDGLGTEGADLSFHFPTDNPTVLTLSFGNRPPHDHDHGHGDEEGHDHDDEHGEDHDEEHGEDHDEEHHDGHEHGEGFEALEPLRVRDDIFTIGLRHEFRSDDFTALRFAAFGGTGDNEEGESSWFAGAGVEWEWRENGLEPGGKSFRWRTEGIHFNGSHGEHGHDDEEEHGHEEGHDEDHHEDDHEEDHDEEYDDVSTWGISTEVLWQAHPHLHPFARIDYVDGVSDLGLEDWTRYTAGVAVPFGPESSHIVRIQGNADERGDESEQSVWLQLGLSFGGAEVR